MRSSAPDTPALMRRIAQLEAVVGRLSEDLGSLRQALDARAPAPGRRALQRTVPAAVPAVAASGGLAGAIARGEAARVAWVREGRVVPAEQLVEAWGLTRQALAAACERGELFSVKVGNRRYYPSAFLGLERALVAEVCGALGALEPAEKLLFWIRSHGALGGRAVADALASGVAPAKVLRLAAAWSGERGAGRVAAAA